MDVIKRIKAERQNHRISPEEVGKAVGKTTAFVAQVEALRYELSTEDAGYGRRKAPKE